MKRYLYTRQTHFQAQHNHILKVLSSPVGDELQGCAEVFVVVGDPLHQGLLVRHFQLHPSLGVVEVRVIVFLRRKGEGE